MADRNKVDYYSVLGVPRTSTPEEIKAAYRTRAKELHPDKNRAENATARFQQLQEAFSILGSPERRLLYDQGNYAAAVDPATQATEAEFDPVPCDGCHCISAQPRFVQYDRVISIIVASYKIRPAGVFCPTCASKRLFINTLITGAVGWLGFWGIFWSIAAIIRNVSGGTKSPGVNAFLLGKQAAYFMQQGKADLGYALANESLEFFKKAGTGDSDYALGKSGAEVARYILNQSTSKRVRLRSRWAGWPVPARYALAGLAVPAVFWAAIFNSSEETKRQPQLASSYARSSAPAVTSAPPAEQYVDMTGQDGHTYRVSMSDYRRLKPIFDNLESRQPGLKASIDDVNTRHTQLENQRASVDGSNSYSVDSFNNNVEAWNRYNDQLRANLAAFDREIDAYNAELERVGRKIR